MERVRCIVCKRKKIVPSEGRIIDGSWVYDKFISKRFWYKWICSFGCYRKLIKNK